MMPLEALIHAGFNMIEALWFVAVAQIRIGEQKKVVSQRRWLLIVQRKDPRTASADNIRLLVTRPLAQQNDPGDAGSRLD
jgi:hypothetical protein